MSEKRVNRRRCYVETKLGMNVVQKLSGLLYEVWWTWPTRLQYTQTVSWWTFTVYAHA